MTTQQEALRLAREALEEIAGAVYEAQMCDFHTCCDAPAREPHYPDCLVMNALAALNAVKEPKPVAWGRYEDDELVGVLNFYNPPQYVTPLYTTPPIEVKE